MRRFLCTHTFPSGAFTVDQLRQFAQAGQQDATVKGYRSFVNLSAGKAVCVVESSDERTVGAWFKKMGMPFDSITPIELEGERGQIWNLLGGAEQEALEPALAGFTSKD